MDIANGYSLGANSYITKPVDIKDFIEAIKQLSLYWMILNKSPKAGLYPVQPKTKE